jgi:hypothetical protein
MIDSFLKLILNEESKRKDLVVLVLKVLVTCTLCSHLHLMILGGYRVLRLDDLAGIVDFLLNGRFVLVIVLFFVVWTMFYGFLPFIVPPIYIALGNRIGETLRRIIFPMLKSNDNASPIRYVKEFFVALGFIKYRDGTLGPGRFTIEVAKVLKRLDREESDSQSVTAVTSPYLILQIGFAYFWVVVPSFQIPLVINTFLLVIGLTLFVSSVFALAIRHFAFVNSEEIIEFAHVDIGPHSVEQQPK